MHKRIVYFCDDVIKSGTAAEEHIRAITTAMQKSDCTVVLLAPNGGVKNIDGVAEILEYSGKNAIIRAVSAIRMFKRVAMSGVDAIYLRYRGSQWLYLMSSTFRHYKRFVEINGIMEVELNVSPLRKHALLAAQKIIERAFLHHSYSIVVTEQMLKHYQSRYSLENIIFVQNGTFPDEFQLKQSWGTGGSIKGVFVGSLVWWQGLDELIEAVSVVENFVLHIFGSGPEANRLENLVAKHSVKNVVFEGHASSSVIRSRLQEFDIGFVTKSIKGEELSPLKLYQYWAAGLPVIATDLQGMNIVEKINAGLTYTMGDVKSLRDVLNRIAQDSNTRRIMGTNGRNYVEIEGNWTRAGQKTIDYIERNL